MSSEKRPRPVHACACRYTTTARVFRELSPNDRRQHKGGTTPFHGLVHVRSSDRHPLVNQTAAWILDRCRDDDRRDSPRFLCCPMKRSPLVRNFPSETFTAPSYGRLFFVGNFLVLVKKRRRGLSYDGSAGRCTLWASPGVHRLNVSQCGR